MGEKSSFSPRLGRILTAFALFVAAMFVSGATSAEIGTDHSFLSAIQRAGINAHDQQGAVDVARRVAGMADSGASDEALRQPVRDFNVADNHVDSFVAASIAAYAPYAQDAAFWAGIQKAGINAHDQQGAVDVARRVAGMADSGASDEALRQPIRDFNVADNHVDSFVAASIAAYGSAQANAKDNDLSGDWRGTCTKVSTGSTWHVDLAIRDDGTYSWTSRFPAAEGSPGDTVNVTGRVDRTSRQLLEDKPEQHGKIDGYYSVAGNRMQFDTGNGMARCSLKR